jgi:hypothetical protein
MGWLVAFLRNSAYLSGRRNFPPLAKAETEVLEFLQFLSARLGRHESMNVIIMEV